MEVLGLLYFAFNFCSPAGVLPLIMDGLDCCGKMEQHVFLGHDGLRLPDKRRILDLHHFAKSHDHNVSP